MKYVMPVIIILILLSAIKSGTDVFSVFLNGAEKGMRTVFCIFPVILAVTVAVNMMRASGLMVSFLSPVAEFFKIPKEVVPLAMIRPISGGGALGVLADTLREFHPDTKIGFIASVIMASSETTFYTLSVYFKNTRAKYTSHIIPAAVFGDIVALLTAVAVSTIIF